MEVHQRLVAKSQSSNLSRPDGITADGNCIVEVILTAPSTTAQASYEDLARAASRIRQRCVYRHRVGGIATDVGKAFQKIHSICRSMNRLTNIGFKGVNGGLSLIMTSYISSVTCYTSTRPMVKASCESLLDDMQVSRLPLSFGKGGGRPDVKLPLHFLDREQLSFPIV